MLSDPNVLTASDFVDIYNLVYRSCSEQNIYKVGGKKVYRVLDEEVRKFNQRLEYRSFSDLKKQIRKYNRSCLLVKKTFEYLERFYIRMSIDQRDYTVYKIEALFYVHFYERFFHKIEDEILEKILYEPDFIEFYKDLLVFNDLERKFDKLCRIYIDRIALKLDFAGDIGKLLADIHTEREEYISSFDAHSSSKLVKFLETKLVGRRGDAEDLIVSLVLKRDLKRARTFFEILNEATRGENNVFLKVIDVVRDRLVGHGVVGQDRERHGEIMQGEIMQDREIMQDKNIMQKNDSIMQTKQRQGQEIPQELQNRSIASSSIASSTIASGSTLEKVFGAYRSCYETNKLVCGNQEGERLDEFFRGFVNRLGPQYLRKSLPAFFSRYLEESSSCKSFGVCINFGPSIGADPAATDILQEEDSMSELYSAEEEEGFLKECYPKKQKRAGSNHDSIHKRISFRFRCFSKFLSFFDCEELFAQLYLIYQRRLFRGGYCYTMEKRISESLRKYVPRLEKAQVAYKDVSSFAQRDLIFACRGLLLPSKVKTTLFALKKGFWNISTRNYFCHEIFAEKLEFFRKKFAAKKPNSQLKVYPNSSKVVVEVGNRTVVMSTYDCSLLLLIKQGINTESMLREKVGENIEVSIGKMIKAEIILEVGDVTLEKVDVTPEKVDTLDKVETLQDTLQDTQKKGGKYVINKNIPKDVDIFEIEIYDDIVEENSKVKVRDEISICKCIIVKKLKREKKITYEELYEDICTKNKNKEAIFKQCLENLEEKGYISVNDYLISYIP